MKVNNITFNVPRQLNAQSFGARIANFEQYKKEKEQRIDPKYYKTMAFAKYNRVSLQGKLDEEKNYRIDLDKDTVNKYLTSSNGMVLPELTQKFIQYFNSSLEYIKTKQAQKRLMRDDDIIQLENMGCFIEAQHFKKQQKPLKDYELVMRAANYAVNFFRLSKTSNGYNFSDFERKINLIGYINELNQENIIAQDEDNLYSQIKNTAQDEKGQLDYNLIYSALSLSENCVFGLPVDNTIMLLKELFKKDNLSQYGILNTLSKLNETYFSISEDNTNAEELMNLCFDKENKFNQKRADEMLEALEIAQDWLCEGMQDMICDNDDEAEELFQNCSNIATESVINYFREKENNPKKDIKECIDEYLDKFAFI